MTRILICDDNLMDMHALSVIIDSFYNKDSESAPGKEAYALFKFYDPVEAAAYIEDGNKVDIAILDIMMPQMNGMDLAEKLREMSFNGYLLFQSSSNDFAAQSYAVNAFSYILKPVQKKKVYELLTNIENMRSNTDQSGFVLTSKGSTRLITFREFTYVEVKSHQLYFHLIDGEIITIYAALKDYSEKLLEKKHIIKPHKSFIVNLDYVRSCENGTLCMRDGTRISVPNDYKSIKEKWMEHIFGSNKPKKS